jgi:hypothetical protein
MRVSDAYDMGEGGACRGIRAMADGGVSGVCVAGMVCVVRRRGCGGVVWCGDGLVCSALVWCVMV